MKILIKTPTQLGDEKLELMRRYVEILEKLEKYNVRARRRLQWYMYQIDKIDKKLEAFK